MTTVVHIPVPFAVPYVTAWHVVIVIVVPYISAGHVIEMARIVPIQMWASAVNIIMSVPARVGVRTSIGDLSPVSIAMRIANVEVYIASAKVESKAVGCLGCTRVQT
jgi:hypothetical protein